MDELDRWARSGWFLGFYHFPPRKESVDDTALAPPSETWFAAKRDGRMTGAPFAPPEDEAPEAGRTFAASNDSRQLAETEPSHLVGLARIYGKSCRSPVIAGDRHCHPQLLRRPAATAVP